MCIAKQLKVKQFHLSVVVSDGVVSWTGDAFVQREDIYRERIKDMLRYRELKDTLKI